jgi:GST-like protein
LQRYTREAERLVYVADRRLRETEYLGGDDYSIADMCTWPWINQMNVIHLDRTRFSHLNRWFEAVAVRPGVQKGCPELPKIMKEPGYVPLTDAQFSRGFGDVMHEANRRD